MKPILLLAGSAMLTILSSNGLLASQLGNEMESMGEAISSMASETDSTKGAELARSAQEATLRSLSILPRSVEALPNGPDKLQAAAQYRKLMAQLYAKLCEIEQAFLKNQSADIPKLLADLKTLKKEGHSQFMKSKK